MIRYFLMKQKLRFFSRPNKTFVKVVFAVECDEDGNCPNCLIDYAECPCLGPTMPNVEYEWKDGIMYGREIVDD